MLNVPQYHHVPEAKIPWWANLHLYVIAMTACIIGLIFSLEAKSYGLVAILAFVFLALFVSALFLGVLISLSSGRDYHQVLKEHKRSDLIFAATSPEYTERSREEIVRFLNTNHKGWSLDTREQNL